MGLSTILKIAYQKRLKLYKNCEELPLRNFFKIISTGDFKYLYKVRNYDRLKSINTEALSMLWGDVILEYADLSNDKNISNSFEEQKIIYQLENSYVVIKVMIRLLMFITPYSKGEGHGDLATKTIADLKLMGYKIDLSSDKAYASSISAADKRANHIISQIKIRKADLATLEGEGSKDISFDYVISSLNTALKFIVPEDITVSRYCEYKKVLIKNAKNAT